MTDTHAHIYLDDFSIDIEEVMRRARNENISEIFLPAIDSSEHDNLLKLEARFPDICRAMIGLHPCSVKENYEDELRIVENYLQQRTFSGIGETGLDYYWDITYKEQQMIAFRKQIQWAKDYKIPVIIHSRNSIDDCIELVREAQDGSLKGIFHCFSGTLEQADQIRELNFFMGIGGVITYKKSGLDAVVAEIPVDYLVLETDAPYLTPVPFRGKRNESSYLKYIVTAIARAKNMREEDIVQITTVNAQKLFGS